MSDQQTQTRAAVPFRILQQDDATTVTQLISRVRGEFNEMPGLKLTSRQAQRLWDLDRGECERVLGRLVRDGFLERTTDGAYVRSSVSRQPSRAQP
jgi:predicted transcriptional regulator of viral defense system